MRPVDDAGDAQPKGPVAPMPPVTTQPVAGRPDAMADGRMVEPFVGQPTVTPPVIEVSEEELPWEGPDGGVVAPAFEADVSETEASLAALSKASTAAKGEAEDFPLDAFIIPEHARRLPTGLETGAPAPPTTPVHSPIKDLADRLEKLSHRMRLDDAEAVIEKLAGGDKLDAMLAGLLAGYLGANK